MNWLCSIMGHKTAGVLNWNQPDKSYIKCTRCGKTFPNGTFGIRMGIAGPDDPIHEHLRCSETSTKQLEGVDSSESTVGGC